MNDYENPEQARSYLNFLASENGQIQQEVLHEAFAKKIIANPNARILDTACGPGWLSHKLSLKFPLVEGCDGSGYLIAEAKKRSPNLNFQVADLEKRLPYSENCFNVVILNMAIHDLENPLLALKELFRVTAENGKLLATLPNPYYAYPVGIWKRGIWRRFFFQKPRLILKTNPSLGKTAEWSKQLTSWNRPLSFYIQSAREAGFNLINLVDITSEQDSSRFNLRYQLHLVPLLLLLEFEKNPS